MDSLNWQHHCCGYKRVLCIGLKIFSASSHYQVVAVLLRDGTTTLAENDLVHPDVDYPDLSALLQYYYQDIDCGQPRAEPVAYIAAEFDASLFPSNGDFVVGDDQQPNDRDAYRNGPLCYGTLYGFFLRVYITQVYKSNTAVNNYCVW